MKILHLSSEYPPQAVFGLGRYVHELAAAQAAAGHTVAVVTNSMGGTDTDTQQNGVRVCRAHFPPPPKAPATSAMLLHFNMQLMERTLEGILDEPECRYDIICAHDWLTFPAAFHIARLLKRPLVTTIHDVVFHKVRRDFNDEDAHIANIENWACQTSTGIVVLSESVRGEVLNSYHAAPEKVHVIPAGVSIEPLAADSMSELSNWRNKFCVDECDLLLYVGRLDPEKGLETLLQAAVQLKTRKAGNWKLAFAGTGKLKQSLVEFSQKSGLAENIIFLDYLPLAELRFAYAAADIVIVPSQYEPFGLVALEAQRMGTPVIVSDTGGLAENIVKTGGGLSFTPGNANELSSHIYTLLENVNDRKSFGLTGQRNVALYYSWANIARKLDEVYESIQNCLAPENVVPKPWAFPQAIGTSVNSVHIPETGTPHPLCDITFICNAASMGAMSQTLLRLASIHPLQILDGHVNVVQVVCDSTQMIPGVSNPRIRYIQLNQIDELRSLYVSSAVVIVQDTIAEALMSANAIDTKYIPTILYGTGKANSWNGWHISDTGTLFTACTKLLSDERVRRTIASNLHFCIPQITWEPPNRTKGEILHVVPQLVTGGAETTLLEIVKGTSQFKHSVLSLGDVTGPIPEELRNAGVKVHDHSNVAPDKIVAFIANFKPDLIHLHSMSYVPKWLPIHRQLATAKIIETEHVVNIGSGHFGRVDTVVCVSNATKAAHDAHVSGWHNSGPSFEVIYNGLDTRNYQNLPSLKEAR